MAKEKMRIWTGVTLYHWKQLFLEFSRARNLICPRPRIANLVKDLGGYGCFLKKHPISARSRKPTVKMH